MRVSKLIKGLPDTKIYGIDVNITSLAINDSTCEKGSMYFAICGKTHNGEDYIASAISNGAKAIVVSHYISECPITQVVTPDVRAAMSVISNNYYHNPQKRLKVIGVIGTNGKTTTSHMLYHILRLCGKKVGLIGTLGVKIGDIGLPNNLTTPDPIELNYYLSQMVNFGCEYVVMEISAHAIALKKLYNIKLYCGIFTNITPEHLDFFSSFKTYARTKIDYFTPENMGYAIVNIDDQYGKQIVFDSGLNTYTYGLYNPADTFAVNIKESLVKSSYVVNSFDDVAKINSPYTGEYNVYNALATFTCTKVMGLGLDITAKLFEHLPQVSGRMELFRFSKDNVVVVDFAHTPDGFEKVLSHITKYRKAGKIITLFGCVGYADGAKRKEMGAIAKKYSNTIILTTDNPDRCSFNSICDDIGLDGDNIVRIEDRKQAIEYGIKLFDKHDTLICLGKGGETKQRIKGVDIPYNEIQIVKDLRR